MNSSTTSDQSRKTKINRQSNSTLAFFCLAIILIALSSCTQGIFETPYGNKTLSVDTLNYDHSIINSIKNISADASGNKLLENKVGTYLDLTTEFMIKFTNFATLSGLDDSIDFVINDANILLYKVDYWGDAANFSIDINMIDNDSALYWTNISETDETFTTVEGQTTNYSTVTFSTDEDSIYIPIDISTVTEWHVVPDTMYVNNGFTVTPSAGSDGLTAFHSTDHTGNFKPRLKIECTLNDTNGIFIKDSTFLVYASGDLQQTENNLDINENLFYMAQGNISRTYITLDSLRTDTLLGPTDLLNYADLKLVMNDSLSHIADGDFIQIGARLFRSDYWELDSIAYNYTAYSDTCYSIDDTISINISQLVQYLISNPKEYDHEGIFFFLNNEYYDFNQVLVDPKKSTLDIVYTRVNNE